MKKIISVFALLMLLSPSFGQNLLHLYHNGSVVFEKSITELDSIKFSAYNSVFNYNNDQMIFAIAEMDSVTFSTDSLMQSKTVYITYMGNTVSIVKHLGQPLP